MSSQTGHWGRGCRCSFPPKLSDDVKVFGKERLICMKSATCANSGQRSREMWPGCRCIGSYDRTWWIWKFCNKSYCI